MDENRTFKLIAVIARLLHTISHGWGTAGKDTNLTLLPVVEFLEPIEHSGKVGPAKVRHAPQACA